MKQKLHEDTPEWRAWGAREQELRNLDIRAAHDTVSLEKAQAQARYRRGLVGLTDGEAIRAMKAARQYAENGDKAREAASIPPKKLARKNDSGQYVIKYDAEVDGDEEGAWVVLTPQAMLSRQGEYFCWLQVDDTSGGTLLMPLREHQIAVFEQAFAEFKRNVSLAQQAKSQT